MSRVARRPLDQAAVSAADDDFYSNHPEMIDGSGNRIPLSPSDPRQRDMRSEWMDYYVANGGELEEPESEREPGDTEEPCSHDPPGPEPTIRARWSKSEVTPDHNSAQPPATPPTDTIPEEAKVILEVDTTEVPDGTAATIEIHQCVTDTAVPDGTLRHLEVRGNRVVDTDSGDRPVWVFEARHRPWDPWNIPYYYFSVTVDYRGLRAATMRDYEGAESLCLRVKYWHVCLSESGSLAGVLPETAAVKQILEGLGHSKADTPDYKITGTPRRPWPALNIYGSHIRNTYVFHQASHGDCNHRTTGRSALGPPHNYSDPPDDIPDPANWRGTETFGPRGLFGDTEIQNTTDVPSVPRYLWYASTCLTGWNSSFADALIARGCRNVIAFRRTIPDADAPELAKKIYRKWVNTYRLDPEKIPDCFWAYAGDYYDSMRPVLFGPGGGRATGSSGLSPLAVVGIVIAAVAVGVLIGVALYSLLK